jgi:dTDP-4-dehydrorhamnose reductase
MAVVPHILVTGGSGQLGRELAAREWPEAAVVLAPPRGALDITDRSAVAALLGSTAWTAVINTAAYTAVDAAEEAVAEAFAVNALGPAILAEETGRRGVPLIHVSTDYVFDGRKNAPYDEDDPVHPLGVYGASKLAGEEAVRTGNPRHLIVRTSWVFGRFGRNFVRTMLGLGAEGRTVRVVDDQWGTPTSAADLAAALAAVALAPDLAERWGTYHFANAGQATWYDLARRVFELSAALGGAFPQLQPIPTSSYPTKAVRPANSRLSTARFERAFGLAPQPWEAALAPVVSALCGASRPAATEGSCRDRPDGPTQSDQSPIPPLAGRA